MADRGSRAGQPNVAIISGLSGAGKTAASKLLEDVGYTVVDNLPAELLRDLVALIEKEPARFERLALVLDARAADAPLAFRQTVGMLQGSGLDPQVLFFEARDDVLIRRFSETRRRHPLDTDGAGVAAAIKRERALLEEIRAESDVIIDTSELSGRQLRERLLPAVNLPAGGTGIALQLISFGYKYGLPLEADIVLDCRFMENPFYSDALRPLSGKEAPVREFVLKQPITQRFLKSVNDFLEFALPAYEAEGKSRLTVALGCTGGFHRSIALAEALAEEWRGRGDHSVSVWHRELDRG
jgi:UPF0042 nucleotide-binding protein